ncbi:hypothetical protein F5B20DRAFT_129172 [Whalleya microplaca]|nr:hypothetical protein F5B20DRAFT_129172 [Whalleya microplaca]
MKYGEHFEQASVPCWSLQNIDYNSLKHQIKTHTTKDQATAIAIPGQQDYALKKFEDAFYLELCNQHDRVGLFVTSKADEISRRLRHLSGLLHQLILRCTEAHGVSVKRQRKFARYELLINECGQDIRSLSRFVNAQVIAFRKILKKYRKWTGSTTLSSRFKENVLSSPKSFTKRDFHPLELQYQELLATHQAACPDSSRSRSEALRPGRGSSAKPRTPTSHRDSRRSSSSNTATPISTPRHQQQQQQPTIAYWNEYDNGSEAGNYGDQDEEGGYVIYIDPNETVDFPGLVYIKTMMAAPVDKVRHWLQRTRSSTAPYNHHRSPSPSHEETRSLLGSQQPTDYFGTHISPPEPSPLSQPQAQLCANTNAPPLSPEEDDDGTNTAEDDYASSIAEEFGSLRRGAQGARPYAASAHDYKMARYRDRILTRSVVLAFAAAFVLLVISGVLISTGRHRLRLEVDAGVTVGCVASLFCGCMGLGAMLYRHFPVSHMYRLAVWAAFAAVVVLNAMLLVLVVGSNGL